MIASNTVILNQVSEGRADLRAYSRFLRNKKVMSEDLIESAVTSCGQLVKGKHVLVVNDTTECNYEDHINFLDRDDEELGPTGNNEDIGFFVHPGLVIDAQHLISLGFSYLKIWNRQYNKKDKHERDYCKQPITEKESYRWIECGLMSQKNLETAAHLTLIADRESDIYQEFVVLPNDRTDLIIRSCRDRKLYGSDKKLYETLSQSDSCGSYALKIKTAKKGKRQARDTEIEIRYVKVKIQKPGQLTDKSLPDYIELHAIEAKEKSENVPVGEKPICWRLLTTYTITGLEEAQQIIRWYAVRWQIELLFTTIKSKGLNIEASELESGKALKNLCIIALQVALKINQLSQGRDREDVGAEITFSKKEIEVLKVLQTQYEGKTELQKNNFKKESIAWAAWTIARMGGWKGKASGAKPGNKTMKWGLDRFKNICAGWYLAKEFS